MKTFIIRIKFGKFFPKIKIWNLKSWVYSFKTRLREEGMYIDYIGTTEANEALKQEEVTRQCIRELDTL